MMVRSLDLVSISGRRDDFGRMLPAVLRFDQMIANGKALQFAETLEFHFGHDVIAVAFDGANGKADRGGDFLVTNTPKLSCIKFASSVNRGCR
jgi:hypothetical protein